MNADTCSLDFRALDSDDIQIAAALCAQAMLHNPLHVKVFGAQDELRLRRLQRFFPALLSYVYRKGQLEGAFDGSRLVGVMGVLPPHRCTPSMLDGMRMLPTMLYANSMAGWWRLAVWLGTWARLDPTEGHWHLGPLAVDADYRRRGIGSRLFTQALNDPSDYPFYLETDLLRNVQLYERYGFQVTATPTILKTPCWIMRKN
ncbi:MAG TPA: GNAT family N-acetyltransferase [Paenalcaligenes sp.]|nr:GNAT family N-acetyltransferase [Paenalcaligenes sp.]